MKYKRDLLSLISETNTVKTQGKIKLMQKYFIVQPDFYSSPMDKLIPEGEHSYYWDSHWDRSVNIFTCLLRYQSSFNKTNFYFLYRVFYYYIWHFNLSNLVATKRTSILWQNASVVRVIIACLASYQLIIKMYSPLTH